MLFRGFDFNNRVKMAEFNGIVQKVIEHLLDFSHIRVHEQLVACQNQLNRHGPAFAGPLKGGGGVADDAVDIKNALVQQDSFGIQVI